MPTLTTRDGLGLAWRELGSGPPLLLHPGGPGASSRYLDGLHELAAERTLLLLDPRGSGDSERPSDRGAYGLDLYAADIEAVRKRIGVEQLDVLGHSHGGFVAITWAGTYPDRVGRLVLANTAARFTDTIRAARRSRAASHEGQPYFEDASAAMRAHGQGLYADDAELMAIYQRELPLLAPVGADTVVVGAALARSGLNADALRHFNDLIAPGMDLRPLLAQIRAPTLVITGEIDPFGESTAHEIAAGLTSPTVVVLPGADHFPFLERADSASWSSAILDFLGT